MDEDRKTTIQISVALKEELDSLKVHPRQSYNEVINRIVTIYKSILLDRRSP